MTALIVLQVVVCMVLIGVILLQPGKGDAGIGFGSSSQSIFGSKGAGNFLTKITGISAILFLLLSYGITRLRLNEASSSVIDSIPEETEATQQVPAPAGASQTEAPPKK